MYIIKKYPYSNGAYGSIIQWNDNTVPYGYVIWPDELDMTNFYDCNGFVTLTFNDDNIVTKYEKNTEKWEEWKTNLPGDPEPEQDNEYVTWSEMDKAIQEGVNNVE